MESFATVGMIRFQADAVIGSIYVTARDAHVAAIGHVDAVVVPVGAVDNFEIGQRHVAAEVERESPTGTVAQLHRVDAHALAAFEIK